MSEPHVGRVPTTPRRWRVGLLVVLRIMLTWTALSAAYFFLPTPERAPDARWMAVQLLVFLVVGAFQVPAIIRSRYPIARAVEALALTVPLFLLIFARIYLETSLHDAGAFSEPLDRTAALYFTVTVFTTVGFGDIVAETSNARLMVVVQMLLNLVVLGAGIRLLASAARRGVARRGGVPDGPGTTAGHP
ncbi:potassium channel family protein [Nocardioides sediminis]|uniref:potassium channel family protein n=1 Tax=Nocardioides sediminis TaxID=433648 RepID=UPI001900268A|nr:potassium channel family protein [Nocardioides sediminis]